MKIEKINEIHKTMKLKKKMKWKTEIEKKWKNEIGKMRLEF